VLFLEIAYFVAAVSVVNRSVVYRVHRSTDVTCACVGGIYVLKLFVHMQTNSRTDDTCIIIIIIIIIIINNTREIC